MDLINNKKYKQVYARGMCKQVVHGIYIAAIWMMESSEYLTVY